MTEKQFIEPHKECRVIKNTKTGETATYYDTIDGLMFLKWLNNLSDENERLKKQVSYLEYRFTEYRNKTLKEIKEMEK